MIPAFRKDQALLDEIEAPLASGALRVTWLGQSGFLIRSEDRRVLVDPYLSDSLTKKYAATDKPHVRMTEQVIEPGALRSIELVTSSHNHTDHLDPETLAPIFAANPKARFLVSEANREFVAKRLECDSDWPVGINAGQATEVAGIHCSAVPAAHNDLDRDSDGNYLYLGYVFQLGRWRVYHSGDTLLYPGIAEAIRACGPIDLALLPINGNVPERRVAGNLDGAEAARLARDIDAKLVVPCHYDLFDFNTADPEALFIPECRRLHQPYRQLRAGESFTLT